MALLTAPIIDGILDLGKEWLQDRQSQREHDQFLIDKAGTQAQVKALIQQIIDRGAIEIENRNWWQERARALGDIFDGDAWKQLREIFGDIGIALPEDPPSPGTEG